MNIISLVAIIVGLKRAPGCIKMHHFEEEHAKNFPGRGTAFSLDPTQLGRGYPRHHTLRRFDPSHAEILSTPLTPIDIKPSTCSAVCTWSVRVCMSYFAVVRRGV